MKMTYAVFIVLIIFPSIYLSVFTGLFIEPNEAERTEAFVARVIDGDTVEIETGEMIRLLGINTPEKGQYYYRESTEFLKDLIEGKTVLLEKNKEDKDKYGRLLRYIHIDSTLVNLELVKKGYATIYMIEQDEKYHDLLLEAESSAKENNIGIWAFSIKDAFCIGIFYFHYNAKGNDNLNTNDEYIVFRNSCTYPVNLNGFILKDKANNTYTFPDITVPEKTKITLHTGPGINNETHLYWGKNHAIWNNNGDELSMWDNNNNLILNYSYS